MFTRRHFISILTSSSLITLINPPAFVFSLTKNNEGASNTPENLIKNKLKFFTPYQAAVIEEVTSLIIPTDSNPGAREAGIVFKLDELASANKKLQQLYSMGVEWLDFMAGKLFSKKRFLDLQSDEMIQILSIADPSKSYSDRANTPEIYGNMRLAMTFFNHMKSYTISNFYTNELGWKVAGYNGPPQWAGNLDYSKCID